jgi:coenzyme F420-0:L-glutamate ligase/coenzyme F420-1:gamma-L-glutamate ligase
VVRGLDVVMPRGEHGPGAAALVRAEEQDMFGLGSRESVLHALLRDEGRGFGQPASAEDVAAALERVLPEATVAAAGDGHAVEVTLPAEAEAGPRRLGAVAERAKTIGFALGWRPSPDRAGVHGDGPVLRFVPVHP